MLHPVKTAGLAIAATGLALSAPIAAAPPAHAPAHGYYSQSSVHGDMSYEHKRKRGKHRGQHYDRGYYGQSAYGGNYYQQQQQQQQRYYGEPVYRDTRVWQGDDGRYYCRKRDGTTGLLIGGAAGALLGREIAGRNGDRTLGAILGAAGGALLGREIDRGGSKCR